MGDDGARPATLIVGLGNPQMGDDGFGLAVLAALARRGVPAGVDLVEAGTDLLAHLDAFARRDRVIVVDAVLSDGVAGRVTCHDEAEMRSWPYDSPTGHQVSPVLALALFRRLWPDATTRICMVALHTDRVAPGEGLTRPATADEGAAAVRRLIDDRSVPQNDTTVCAPSEGPPARRSRAP